MTENAHKVVVIGHKNPDTDSICSAIAYAELKNLTGQPIHEARRAGEPNQETSYVLQRFGLTPPRLCNDVNPKVRDVDYRRFAAVKGDLSLRRAWTMMRDAALDTLPVVDDEGHLTGLISVKDIATANMAVFDTQVLAKSRTSYRNILETLQGTMLTGSPDAVVEKGKVVIGVSSPDIMETVLEEGDIVILSNRYESQLCAIEMNVSLIIVCLGSSVARTILKLAEENGVAIMSVPMDTYAAAKLISQCAPISHSMTTENLLNFNLSTPVDDVLRVMAKVRHRYFPILDGGGKYCGMLSRRNVINMSKRQVILMDHNETTQAIDGYDKADILEIIDHHRLGDLQTAGPMYFRCQPVGCTATIVAQMYDEQGLVPRPQIAGALLGAILSDTLMFRSPTCTPLDEATARRMAELAGVQLEQFANEMFEAGEGLEGKTAEQVLLQDFKVFTCGDVRFGVAQGNYMTLSNLQKARDLLTPGLVEFRRNQHIEDLYVLLTHVPEKTSTVLYSGRYAASMLAEGFEIEPANGAATLPGLISRKKQFIPKILAAYQEL
ncbi:MAG: putative manganese-dependent inorganic diphosphatase [Faecalibacterium sp.]|nr:putative manganese-dependent inorganic diphosphatase [Faecalibacterium sp.]